MHFSRPSGQRLSWCLPWKRGAVGRFSSGYITVSTLRNICRKVTPKPLIEFRMSGTGDLLLFLFPRKLGAWLGRAAAVIVRQVHRRDRERGPVLLDRLRVLDRGALGPALAGQIPGIKRDDDRRHDEAEDQVDHLVAEAVPTDQPDRCDQQRPGQRAGDQYLPAE